MEFIKVVLLPSLAIAAAAFVAMLICYLNPKLRHLVGPDPELVGKKKEDRL